MPQRQNPAAATNIRPLVAVAKARSASKSTASGRPSESPPPPAAAAAAAATTITAAATITSTAAVRGYTHDRDNDEAPLQAVTMGARVVRRTNGRSRVVSRSTFLASSRAEEVQHNDFTFLSGDDDEAATYEEVVLKEPPQQRQTARELESAVKENEDGEEVKEADQPDDEDQQVTGTRPQRVAMVRPAAQHKDSDETSESSEDGHHPMIRKRYKNDSDDDEEYKDITISRNKQRGGSYDSKEHSHGDSDEVDEEPAAARPVNRSSGKAKHSKPPVASSKKNRKRVVTDDFITKNDFPWEQEGLYFPMVGSKRRRREAKSDTYAAWTPGGGARKRKSRKPPKTKQQ
jgi:hypothetical protein